MNATIISLKMTWIYDNYTACSFINLLFCSAAYLVISETVKKISRMREFATVSDFQISLNICRKQWDDAKNWNDIFL